MKEWLGFFRGIGQKYVVSFFSFLLLTIVAVIIWRVIYPDEEALGVLVAALVSLTLVIAEVAFTLYHLDGFAIGIMANQEKLAERQTITFRYELLKMQEATISTQRIYYDLMLRAIQRRDPPNVQVSS